MSNLVSFHRLSAIASVLMLVVVAMGSVITTMKWSDVIPDWPLAFGRWIPSGHFNGPVDVVWTHRLLAAVTSALVLGLAAGSVVLRLPRAIRLLVGGTAVLMLVQVWLGAEITLQREPEWLGLLHASLAQLSVLGISLAALYSGQSKRQEAQVYDYGWPSFRSLSIILPPAVYLQILLAAGYRHHIWSLVPHIVGAMVVALLLVTASLFVLTQFPKHETLRELGTDLLKLIFLQLALGVGTYVGGMSEQNPIFGVAGTALVAAAHVVAGTLLLVLCTWLAIQTRRFVLPRRALATQAPANL